MADKYDLLFLEALRDARKKRMVRLFTQPEVSARLLDYNRKLLAVAELAVTIKAAPKERSDG